jgi:ferric-dicitrate binding protein FerR (iron transport regulator)
MDAHTPRPHSALPETGPDDHLWERFLTGECSSEDHVRVERWIHEEPSRTRIVDAWARAAETPRPNAERNAERLRQRFWATVNTPSDSAAVIKTFTHSRERGALGTTATWRHRPVVKLVAAAGLAALAFGVVKERRTLPLERATETIYETRAGERATIALADGSRIVLAPGTHVSMRSEPKAHGRTVTLTGEAYFDVAGQRTPFTVRTGTITTRVLGTQFTVRQYPGDPDTRVAVASGKVSVAGETRRRFAITVNAGTVARITDSTVQTTRATDLEPYTAWTRGRLRFDDAPATEVLQTVGRWYGYEFKYRDSLLVGSRVTATFDKLSTPAMFTLIERLLGVKLHFDGRIVTLREAAGDPEKTSIPRRGTTEHMTPSREVGR